MTDSEQIASFFFINMKIVLKRWTPRLYASAAEAGQL